MSNNLMHIAGRVLNTPLFLLPTKTAIIQNVLSGRIGSAPVVVPQSPEANRLTGDGSSYVRDGLAYTMRGDTPVIPIIGTLINRGAYVSAESGVVSYEGIEAQLDKAIGEQSPTTIALDIDTPGGEATGMFSLAKKVRSIRDSGIEIIAIVNDVAASAGYGIAAQASEIWISPTSIVGSIGVVMVHSDHSGELKKKGINTTLIYAGEHKTDGNPFGPLSKSVRADLKREVMIFYDQFIKSVSDGRGDRLSAEAARATKARIMIGEEAIEAGLADRMGSVSDLNETANTGTKAGSQRRTVAMTTKPKNGQTAAENADISQEDHDAAIVSATAEGKTIGAKSEKERISAIVRHEAAANKPKQAMSLALDTNLSVDQAAAVLGNSLEETSTKPDVSQELGNDVEIGASAAGTIEASTKSPVAEMAAKSVERINARNRA